MDEKVKEAKMNREARTGRVMWEVERWSRG